MGCIVTICLSRSDEEEPILQNSNDARNVVMKGGDILIDGQCVHCGKYISNDGISVMNYFYLRLQEDGELILYTPTFMAGNPMHILWRTGTVNKGKSPYKMKLEMNANLVVYDSTEEIMWQSNSAKMKCEITPELVLGGESFGIRVGKKIIWKSKANI